MLSLATAFRLSLARTILARVRMAAAGKRWCCAAAEVIRAKRGSVASAGHRRRLLFPGKTYAVIPVMADGTCGQVLSLRALFEQFLAETR
jgi:hypothetical protein